MKPSSSFKNIKMFNDSKPTETFIILLLENTEKQKTGTAVKENDFLDEWPVIVLQWTTVIIQTYFTAERCY